MTAHELNAPGLTAPNDLEAGYRDDLPEILRDLADLIGFDAVLKLMNARLFGWDWRISKTRSSEWYSAWAAVLGEDLTDKVMHAWGGEEIYFPNSRPVFIRLRNQNIVRRYDDLLREGASTRRARRTLCQETGLSDKTIRVLVNSHSL